MRYADVIVPLAVEGMYTYTVPVSLESEVREGTLVLVSFAGNKRYTALVGRIHDQAPVGYQVKPIEDVVEKQVSFSALHLRFLLWLGGYYMATPGEVMKAALPVAFRLESFTSITRTTEEVDYAGLTTNEKILLRFLQPGEYVSLKEAEKYLKIKNGLPLVRNLLARNYIQIKETVVPGKNGAYRHLGKRVYRGRIGGVVGSLEESTGPICYALQMDRMG